MEPYEIVQRLKALEDEVKELRQRIPPADPFFPGVKIRKEYPLISKPLWGLVEKDALREMLDASMLGAAKLPIRMHHGAGKPALQVPPRPCYVVAGIDRPRIAYLCKRQGNLEVLDDLIVATIKFKAESGVDIRDMSVYDPTGVSAPWRFDYKAADTLAVRIGRETFPGSNALETSVPLWLAYQNSLPKEYREPGYDA